MRATDVRVLEPAIQATDFMKNQAIQICPAQITLTVVLRPLASRSKSWGNRGVQEFKRQRRAQQERLLAVGHANGGVFDMHDIKCDDNYFEDHIY